jgi:SAM-dependent methyltransferase
MFASKIIAQKKPTSILDIGSFRIFIIGLLSFYKITTIDLRKRKSFLKNETIITRDAKNLLLPDNSFDIVVSLSCLPHLGLGRYGDKLDLDADKKVFKEIIRVLKPGGILIFSSYITKRSPFIAFNAHRTYNYQMFKALCNGLELREEKFYSFEKNSYCSLDQITDKRNCYDIYCGCWGKNTKLDPKQA